MTVKGIHRQRAWDPVSRHGVKKQNKNNLCSRYFCELAFMLEVLLMVKDSRKEFKSRRAAWSTQPTLVSLPVCKRHNNSASAVVTGTTPAHKQSTYH